MDTLPEEVLQEIMEYLGYNDLKCFRLVCKKFYDASLTFRIANRDKFAYGREMILTSRKHNFDNFMKALSTTKRNFYHFHLVHMEITVDFDELFEKRAEYILSLKFEECEIMYHPMGFCWNINECSKLISLKLHHMSCSLVWNRRATISLPALETLDLSHIPDDMFNALMNTNVKNLHLRVPWHRLNDVIHTRGSLEDLKCVDLSDSCTDEQLMKIADKLNLTTIRIRCRDVTDRGFKYFLEKQRGLQIVEMYGCRLMTDESLFAILEYLKDLKELKIIHPISEYSFDALNRIINLTPVRHLVYYAHSEYSRLAGTVGDVTVTKCLRQLRMNHVENETYVTYIAKNFLSLTELELTQSDGVTTETLQLICQNMKNLKKLNLSERYLINGFENAVSQLTFSANFNNLEELNLSASRWLSDSILETCFKLSSLRILNVAFCKQLTVKSFVAMPNNFPCLEDLNMAGLEVDKDILFSTVSLMKRLCTLNIWVSEQITNDLLNLFHEHSDSLHRVNLGIDDWCFIRSWDRKTFVNASPWQ